MRLHLRLQHLLRGTPSSEKEERFYDLQVQVAGCSSLHGSLRRFVSDETLRGELYDLMDAGLMSRRQAEDTMAAANRPMFCLSAMSATLRKADLPPINAARIDSTISVLVDLTGANERIFKSPIPLIYTRLLARFRVELRLVAGA